MKKENICKFINNGSSANLNVLNFVFESKAPNSGAYTFPSANTMCLVASGQGKLYTETGMRELLPGCLFFTFAGNAFRIDNCGELVYMYITFDGQRSEELFSRFGISPSLCCFPGYEGLVPLWQDRLVRADGLNIDLITESVLLYTFAKMRCEPKEKKTAIEHVLKYIEENYRDSTLSLVQTANAVGYNPKYLSRLFKSELNRGFSDYVTTVRINHAVFLIGQGVTSIKNLAILCGYSDPLYFSKVFHRVIGLSPRDYMAGL